MSRDPMDLLAGIGRELVVAVATWIGALTALFVVYGSLQTGLRARARRQGVPLDAMRDVLPVSEGPVFAQWAEFVASYSTFDYGVSLEYGEPVATVFGQAFGSSLTLLVGFVLVTAALTVAVVGVTTRLSPRARGALTVPAYVVGVLAPLVGGMFVLWLAYATGSLPTSLTPPPTTGAGGVNTGLLIVVSFVVALPVVGDAARRAHRESESGDPVTLGTLFGPGNGGFGTVELWGYLLYLASSLVVVESLFTYRGLGWYLYEGINNNDVTVLLGMAAGLAFVLVVCSLLRNVVWVIVRFVRSDPGRLGPATAGPQGPGGGVQQDASGPPQGTGDAGAGNPPPNQQAGAGGQPAGQQSRTVRQQTGQGPSAGAPQGQRSGPSGPPAGGPAGQSGRPPAPQRSRGSSLWNAIIGDRKIQAGAGLLALAAVLGFVGALAVPVDSVGFQRPPAPGLTGGIFLNTLASFATGIAVTLVVATVLGVVPGLIAGFLEGKEIGPGTVLSTILRIPSEVAIVVPFAFAGVLYVAAFTPEGPGGSATAVGVVTGLVLAGFAFRAVYEAASRRIAATGPNADWIGASLVGSAARLDFVAVVAVFVAGELTFLGMLPYGSGGPYLAYVQLNVAFTNFAFLFTQGGNVVGVLLAVVLTTAPFALGFYLIGDGLGAIAARLRSGGLPAPTPTRGPPTAPAQPAGQQQAPPQGTPQAGPPQGGQPQGRRGRGPQNQARGQPRGGQPSQGQPQQGQPPQGQPQQGQPRQGQPPQDQPQGQSPQSQPPRDQPSQDRPPRGQPNQQQPPHGNQGQQPQDGQGRSPQQPPDQPPQDPDQQSPPESDRGSQDDADQKPRQDDASERDRGE